MKFTNLIALLALSSCIISIGAKNLASNKAESLNSNTEGTYTALILGDIGQFDQFAGKDISKMAEAELETNYLYAGKDLKVKECSVLPLTMKNFQTIFPKISAETSVDEVVILGDAVYTEGKGVGATAQALTTAKKTAVADRMTLELVKRLNCAWETVKKLLFDVKSKIGDKTAIVFGNHSMDVDYTTELVHLTAFHPWKEAKMTMKKGVEVSELLLAPYTSNGLGANGKTVLWIDVDMSKLICSARTATSAEFSKCLNDNYLSAYPGYAKAMQDELLGEAGKGKLEKKRLKIIDYIKKLEAKLDTVKLDKSKWKIIRVHQPIFNIERDFYGVKNNAELMSKFKQAHIHVWLVSHHHSAQINIAKYEGKYDNVDYKYKFSADTKLKRGPNEFGNVLTPETTTTVTFETKEFITTNDFFYTMDNKGQVTSTGNGKKVPEVINRCGAILKTCLQGKEGTIRVKPLNEEYILQVLAGNGGRKLDPLISDLFSDANMIYGRAKMNEFGYYKATFTGDAAKFELKTSAGVVFTLNVVQAADASDKTNFVKENFTAELKVKGPLA